MHTMPVTGLCGYSDVTKCKEARKSTGIRCIGAWGISASVLKYQGGIEKAAMKAAQKGS